MQRLTVGTAATASFLAPDSLTTCRAVVCMELLLRKKAYFYKASKGLIFLTFATFYKIFFGISRYFVAAICKNTIYCVFEKLKNTICCGVLKKGETSRTRFTLNFRFSTAPSQAAGIVCVVRRAQRVGAVARERDNNISYGLAKRTNQRRVRNQCL